MERCLSNEPATTALSSSTYLQHAGNNSQRHKVTDVQALIWDPRPCNLVCQPVPMQTSQTAPISMGVSYRPGTQTEGLCERNEQ